MTATRRPGTARQVRAGRAGRAGQGDIPVPEHLVTVATRLFAEKGFENTSVQEIVAAAGFTKGALYHYYESKDDLLYEIYHRVLAMQLDRLERFAAMEGPVAERLRAAAVDVLETSADRLDEMVVFFQSMHLLPPAKQAAVRADRRRYHERFRGMVEEGQRSGVFRDDVSADLVTHSFFGAIHHLGSWFHPDGALTAAEVGAVFADLLLGGLLVR
jgi:AcrR family transcriptional regulator